MTFAFWSVFISMLLDPIRIFIVAIGSYINAKIGNNALMNSIIVSVAAAAICEFVLFQIQIFRNFNFFLFLLSVFSSFVLFHLFSFIIRKVRAS